MLNWPGGATTGIGQRRGHVHGRLDIPRRDSRIIIAQCVESMTVLAVVLLHGRRAAPGRQFQAERMVAETRHIEVSPPDASVPRQRQRPNAAAKADAEIADTAVHGRKQRQQGRHREP